MIGTTAAILIGAAMASAAAVGGSAMAAHQERVSQKKILASADAKQKEMQERADAAAAMADAAAKQKRAAKYAAQTQTVLTSPLGLTDAITAGGIQRPTLLGGGND